MDLAVSRCVHLYELISLPGNSLIRRGGFKWLVAGLGGVFSLPTILVTVSLAQEPRANRFDCRRFPEARLLGHLRQRIDDGAFGYVVSGTLRHGGRQDVFDAFEIRDLGADRGEMRFRKHLHLAAGLGPAIDQCEQIANLVEREPELARAHDEAQACDMPVIVDAIIFAGARRLGHDADVLVIANGLEVASGQLGQIAAPEGLH